MVNSSSEATIFQFVQSIFFSLGLPPNVVIKRSTLFDAAHCLRRDLRWHSCSSVSVSDQFHLALRAGMPSDCPAPLAQQGCHAAVLIASCTDTHECSDCTYAGVNASGALSLGASEAALELEPHCVPCAHFDMPANPDAAQVACVLVVFAALAALPVITWWRVRARPPPADLWPALPRSSLAWAMLLGGWVLVLAGLVPIALVPSHAHEEQVHYAFYYSIISTIGLVGLLLGLRSDDPHWVMRLVLLVGFVFAGFSAQQMSLFLIARIQEGRVWPSRARAQVSCPGAVDDSDYNALPSYDAYALACLHSVEFFTTAAHLVNFLLAACRLVRLSNGQHPTLLRGLWRVVRTVFLLVTVIESLTCGCAVVLNATRGPLLAWGYRDFHLVIEQSAVSFGVGLLFLLVTRPQTRLRLHLGWRTCHCWQLGWATSSSTASRMPLPYADPDADTLSADASPDLSIALDAEGTRSPAHPHATPPPIHLPPHQLHQLSPIGHGVSIVRSTRGPLGTLHLRDGRRPRPPYVAHAASRAHAADRWRCRRGMGARRKECGGERRRRERARDGRRCGAHVVDDRRCFEYGSDGSFQRCQ
jgi:hypothetical protein